MKDLKIWLVDAFTDTPFKGNPAAVCFMTAFLPDPLLQQIAAKLNWSQTAFVVQKSPDHFHIRWFSPRDEAPICGHATLASAKMIWHLGITTAGQIFFDSLGGPLTATRESNGNIALDFPAKPVYPCVAPVSLQRALGEGVNVTSVYRDDLVYLVELSSAESVQHLRPRLELIEQLECRAVIVTSRGRGNYDFESRYFAPRVGIPEDPVCGSAHCRLAVYWSKLLKKNTFLAYQSSPRGGVLNVCLQDNERVSLSGQATLVAEGCVNLDAFSPVTVLHAVIRSELLEKKQIIENRSAA